MAIIPVTSCFMGTIRLQVLPSASLLLDAMFDVAYDICWRYIAICIVLIPWATRHCVRCRQVRASIYLDTLFETCHELHGRAESLWASKRYGKVF